MSEPVFVMCSVRCYKLWCEENNISINDRRFRNLSKEYQLRGFRNPTVLRFADFRELKEYKDIELMIAARTFKEEASSAVTKGDDGI